MSISDYDFPVMSVQKCRRSAFENASNGLLLLLCSATPFAWLRFVPMSLLAATAEVLCLFASYGVALELVSGGWVVVLVFFLLCTVFFAVPFVYSIFIGSAEVKTLLPNPLGSPEETQTFARRAHRKAKAHAQALRRGGFFSALTGADGRRGRAGASSGDEDISDDYSALDSSARGSRKKSKPTPALQHARDRNRGRDNSGIVVPATVGSDEKENESAFDSELDDVPLSQSQKQRLKPLPEGEELPDSAGDEGVLDLAAKRTGVSSGGGVSRGLRIGLGEASISSDDEYTLSPMHPLGPGHLNQLSVNSGQLELTGGLAYWKPKTPASAVKAVATPKISELPPVLPLSSNGVPCYFDRKTLSPYGTTAAGLKLPGLHARLGSGSGGGSGEVIPKVLRSRLKKKLSYRLREPGWKGIALDHEWSCSQFNPKNARAGQSDAAVNRINAKFSSMSVSLYKSALVSKRLRKKIRHEHGRILGAPDDVIASSLGRLGPGFGMIRQIEAIEPLTLQVGDALFPALDEDVELRLGGAALEPDNESHHHHRHRHLRHHHRSHHRSRSHHRRDDNHDGDKEFSDRAVGSGYGNEPMPNTASVYSGLDGHSLANGGLMDSDVEFIPAPFHRRPPSRSRRRHRHATGSSPSPSPSSQSQFRQPGPGGRHAPSHGPGRGPGQLLSAERDRDSDRKSSSDEVTAPNRPISTGISSTEAETDESHQERPGSAVASGNSSSAGAGPGSRRGRPNMSARSRGPSMGSGPGGGRRVVTTAPASIRNNRPQIVAGEQEVELDFNLNISDDPTESQTRMNSLLY